MERIFGASLSEPHTSGTALRRCVYLYDRLTVLAAIYRKSVLNARLNISRKLNVLVHLHGNAGLMPEYSVDNHSGEDSSLRTHGTLLLVCHSSYGPTINSRLLADHPKFYMVG